jgi:hypothetical protein
MATIRTSEIAARTAVLVGDDRLPVLSAACSSIARSSSRPCRCKHPPRRPLGQDTRYLEPGGRHIREIARIGAEGAAG